MWRGEVVCALVECDRLWLANPLAPGEQIPTQLVAGTMTQFLGNNNSSSSNSGDEDPSAAFVVTTGGGALIRVQRLPTESAAALWRLQTWLHEAVAADAARAARLSSRALLAAFDRHSGSGAVISGNLLGSLYGLPQEQQVKAAAAVGVSLQQLYQTLSRV